MRPEDEVKCIFSYSLRKLDGSLGMFTAGRVVSGNRVPSYKDTIDREDPLRLTQRVMVRPLLNYLGYDDVFSGDVFNGRVPGASVATVTMNSDLPSAVSRMLCSMRADDSPKGIATDGFRWLLAEKDEWYNGKVKNVVDLRPYYVETLELIRFRGACPRDERDLREFIDVFGNDRRHIHKYP